MWEPAIHNYGGVWSANGGFDASQGPQAGPVDKPLGIGRRHKKGAVITGFSGQVHFIKFGPLIANKKKYNKPGLLWCVPDSRTGQ